jgi:hypothetical protein
MFPLGASKSPPNICAPQVEVVVAVVVTVIVNVDTEVVVDIKVLALPTVTVVTEVQLVWVIVIGFGHDKCMVGGVEVGFDGETVVIMLGDVAAALVVKIQEQAELSLDADAWHGDKNVGILVVAFWDVAR